MNLRIYLRRDIVKRMQKLNADFVNHSLILTAGATGGTNGGFGTVFGKSTSHSSKSSHRPHFPPKAREQKCGPSMAP